ncbi:hypothetical protein Q7M_1307 (plasmid) [Borrelia crocidurae str. Achema]|uniref:Uncharacterized protein n=1 Tax=Borrelia crocidurae (strain Achema) TaxID=1155096 RepID=I0FF07_BORCA|nr:hypothetical protein Q7M_1307 [Borrelia crocidurae str. Achema]
MKTTVSFFINSKTQNLKYLLFYICNIRCIVL